MQRTYALMRVVLCLSFGLITLAGSAARAAINSATLSPATLPASGGFIYVNADITLSTQIQSVMAILNYNGIPGNQVYLFNYQGGSQYSGDMLLQETPMREPAVITATIVVTDVNGLTTTAQTGEVVQGSDAEPPLVIADAVLSSATLPASGGKLTISAFLPGAPPNIEVAAEVYCNGILSYDFEIPVQTNREIYSTTFTTQPNDSHLPQVLTALVAASYGSIYGSSGVTTRAAVGSALQAASTDITPPVIAQPLITPSTETVLGGTVTISALITDPGADATGVNLVNAQILQDGVGFTTVTLRRQFGSSLSTAQVSIPGNTNGQGHTYTATLQATDNADNLSFAPAQGSCKQPPGDAQPPIITNAKITPVTLPATGGSITVTATVTDSGGTNVGVGQVTAYLLRDGVAMSGVATLYRENAGSVYTGEFGVGQNRTASAYHYTMTVVAADNLQNQSSAPAKGVCVQANDNQPPVITQAAVSPATLPVTGGTLTISAIVTDQGGANTGVRSIVAYVYINGRPDGSSVTLTNHGGSLYSGTYSVLPNGFNQTVYTASVIAQDTVYNQSWSKANTVCVVAAQQDKQPPKISGAALSPATLPTTGGTLTVTASVTDAGGVNTGISQVTAQIYVDDYQATAILLTNTGTGSDYTGTYAAPAATTMPHSYVAVVFATDKAGNQSNAPIPGSSTQAGTGGASAASIGTVSLSPTTLPTSGGMVTVTASATVPAGSFLYADILINSSYFNTIALTNSGSGTVYSGTQQIYSRDGTPATIVALASIVTSGYTTASALSNFCEQRATTKTPPQITSVTVSPATLPAAGGVVTIHATAMETSGTPVVIASLSANSVDIAYYVRLSNHGQGTDFTGTVTVGGNDYTSRVIEAAVTAYGQGGSAAAGSSNTCVQSVDLSPSSVKSVVISPAALPVAGGLLHIRAQVASQTGVDDIYAVLYRDGVPTLYTSIALSNGGAGNVYTGTYAVPRNDGSRATYTVTVSFYDGETNFVSGASNPIVQQGAPITAPPIISHVTLTPPHLPTSGGTITLSAHVTAPAGVQSVTAQIFQDGLGSYYGPFAPLSRKGTSDLYVGTYTVPKNFQLSATYTAGVQVTDIDGRSAAAPAVGTCIQAAGVDMLATIRDITLSPPVVSAAGGTITVRATVIDPQGVSSVQAYILRDGIQAGNMIYLSNGGHGNVYVGTATAYPNPDSAVAAYTADIYTFRSGGAYTTAVSRHPAVQLGDNQPPSVQSIALSPKALGVSGGTLTVRAIVSDTGGGNTGVQTVMADFFRNGVLVKSLPLAAANGRFYSGAYAVPANADADCAHWTAVLVASDFLNNQTTVSTPPVVQASAATQPAPTVTDVRPALGFAGGDVTLTLTGTGFGRCSVVSFGQFRIVPTFVFPDTITVTIPAADTDVAGDTSVSVTNRGPGGGLSEDETFTLLPSPVRVSVAPRSVLGGSSATGTVTLSDIAPEDEIIPLTCDAPAVTLPANVLVPAGARSAAFSMMTVPVDYHQSAAITAQAGASPSGILSVLAPAPAALTLLSSTIFSNERTRATVTLSQNAVAGGQWVRLTSTDDAVASTPNFVIVPGGTKTASFPVAAGTVTQARGAEITADVDGQTMRVFVQVKP